MAAPGRPVTLVAELLEDGFFTQSPLGGEVVLFEHQGRAVGRALTGGDGRARVPFVPRALGMGKVLVRVAESPRVAAPEATAGLFVWDRRHTIVVVSVNALVPRPRKPVLELPFPRPGARRPDPAEGAVRALEDLARRAHLIYVTRNDRREVPEIRLWMEQHRLPRGPVVPLKPVPMSLARELDQWRRDGWTNLKGGIVESPDEAKALADHKLKAVAAPTVPAQETWPEQTIRLKDWPEAAKQFR